MTVQEHLPLHHKIKYYLYSNYNIYYKILTQKYLRFSETKSQCILNIYMLYIYIRVIYLN